MVDMGQDLNDVEAFDPGSGGKVTVGFHELEIVEVEAKVSTSNFPILNIKYRVVSGPAVGGTIYGSRSLHPNALPFFKGFLEVVNCFATQRNFDEQKLVGRYLKGYAEEYTKTGGAHAGEQGTRIEKVFKSEINFDKNSQIDLSLSARPERELVTAGAGKPGNGKAAGANSSPKPSDDKVDDLPF